MKNLKYCVDYKDMFNVYNLITKIDGGYKLVFEQKHKLFLIINSAKNNQICLKTSQLSPNIINLLKKSRIENFHCLIEEIDKNNEELERKNINNFKNLTTEKMVDTLKTSKRISSFSNSDIQKIIGE